MVKDFYHLKRDNNPHREDAFTLSCLGKLHPASRVDFLRCGGYLSGLLDEALFYKSVSHQLVNSHQSVNNNAVVSKSVSQNSNTVHHNSNSLSHNSNSVHHNKCLSGNRNDDEILIIGLTESGIIPALLMYLETLGRDLNTSILYSTRRPLSGIAFKETHSHGPDHILPLPDCKISEIWIVEDEITSGNTVCNLMVQLCEYLDISRVRIFAFADFRDSQQKSDFALKTAQDNIKCDVHTLSHISDFTRQNEKMIKSENQKINHASDRRFLNKHLNTKHSLETEHFLKREALENWNLPEKRPSLAMKSGDFLDVNSWKLPPEISKGTILVIGESVDLAACFALANEDIMFQQISLSPWKVDNKSIFSRMSFAGKYYLYNYERLKDPALHPIFILCDPIDRDIEKEAVRKLGKHGIYAKPIFQGCEQSSMEPAFLSQS
ncbi:MAG: phosphoribosyltransferase domain-containing protein [Desulfamplus sp.]|nr:phosphoribosyltransferase domain-containing protein [Desulfamplus sp.]